VGATPEGEQGDGFMYSKSLATSTATTGTISGGIWKRPLTAREASRRYELVTRRSNNQYRHSAIQRRPGSAARTRTPTAYSVSAARKAPT
jgi:Na+/glutamate symporter